MAGEIGGLGAPIVSGLWLALCSSSVGCRGPSVASSRLVGSKVVGHSSGVVVGVVVELVLSCDTGGSGCYVPCRRFVRRVAALSSCIVRFRHAR